MISDIDELLHMARLKLSEIPDYSFYVKRSLQAISYAADDAQRLALLEQFAATPWTREQMIKRLEAIDDSETLNREMRLLRRETMLGTIARDLTGTGGFEEVVRAMTDLAEVTVGAAVRVHSRELARRFGVPTSREGVPQDMLVVGMGKLGGEELNVSSDIDLVFVYDEAGETRPSAEFSEVRRSISNHEFFEKLAKRVIPAISDLDGTGFVFRVDMRLRPFGDSGPIVVSSEMLEEYLYTEGRDWERFAWLKGLVVNTPVFASAEQFEAAVSSLTALVRPFVYRKYVDFSAISSLTRLHELIRAESVRREAGRDLGINVKLGRGGIREIEFITQTFQIIRGGRDAALRGRQTLPMLAELARIGALDETVVGQLSADYVFLRNLEHALQYVDDKQTQLLPPQEPAQQRVAHMIGMTHEQMMQRLQSVREFVSETFDAIFHIEAPAEETLGWPIGWQLGDDASREGLSRTLADLGYGDAASIAGRICKLMRSRLMASRTQDAREQFSRFIVTAAENCLRWARLETASVSGDEVFHRILNLLEVITGRATYVQLLNQYPSAADRVGRMLAVSRWAADYLVEHPLLLDELVDGREQQLDDYTPVDWSGWLDALREQMHAAQDDRERQINLLKDAHHGALFHLLQADLAGRLTVERLADQLSALADAVLELVIELAWQSIATRHRETPRFAVIGYGKLGGKELGYASDLDIIFLYDDDDPAASTNYAKLVRRMLSWLTVQTSSGILFDVDMRLRPNGENGLIASNMEMFRRYQRNLDGNGAWEWEHQALTRARFCAGDPDVGREFEKERAYILSLPRQAKEVAGSVIEMRRKMLDGHINSTPLFDVKHDRGGMVDIEFIVQMLVLSYSAEHPQLVNNFGNSLLLEMAGEIGLVPSELAQQGVSAYRRYRNIQREIRLSQGEGAAARVEPELVAKERAAVLALWKAVFETDEPQRNV